MSQSKTFQSSASILSWDEDRSQTHAPRLTPATVKMSLPEVKGTVTSHYAMIYFPKPDSEEAGDAQFTFSDLVEAEDFGGHSGSFITRGKGTFDASRYRVEGQFVVVDGTAKGSLAKLFTGESSGNFRSDEKDPTKVTYTFNA